jgi:MFS family permease
VSFPGPPRRDFAILFAVLMSVAAGNTALSAVLPAIGREVGLPDTAVAGVFSLSALLWAVTAPYWARASDRRGRKPLIQLGLLGYGVSMTGFGLVVLAGLNGWIGTAAVFAGLMLTRSLFGLTGSASPPAAQAYVADRTTPEERTPAFSVLASAFGLGTVLGPAVAPFLALEPVGLVGPIFTFAAVAFAILAVVTWGLRETPPETLTGAPAALAEAPRQGVWKDPSLRPFLLYAFVLTSIQAVNVSSLGFFVIDVLEMPPARAQSFIGAALMAGAAAGLLAQWGLIPMLRMTPRSLMRWGCGLVCLGNAAMMVAPDYGTVVFGYALASLGFGLGRPGFTAGSSLAAPAGAQGAVAGALTAVVGASFVVAPVAGVALYAWMAPAAFLVNAVAAVALLFYAMQNEALKRAMLPAEPQPSLD